MELDDDVIFNETYQQQIAIRPGAQSRVGNPEGILQSTGLLDTAWSGPIERRNICSQKQWMDFANGGALEMDADLETLIMAKDASSEKVQQAMLRVDDRLIPKALKQSNKPKETTNPQVPHLLDLD